MSWHWNSAASSSSAADAFEIAVSEQQSREAVHALGSEKGTRDELDRLVLPQSISQSCARPAIPEVFGVAAIIGRMVSSDVLTRKTIGHRKTKR